MRKNKFYILALTVFIYSNILIIENSFAGIGDGGGLFQSSEEGSETESSPSGSNTFFESGTVFENTSFNDSPLTHEGPPDNPIGEEPIPLDGGAIALLISGGIFGMRKLFNQKKA